MLRRKCLFLVLIALMILLFPSFAAASTNEPRGMGFFFVEDVELTDENTADINVLFLCNGKINTPVSGAILTIGGTVEQHKEVEGIILTLFTKTLSTAQVKYGIINLKTLSFPFDLLIGILMLAVFKEFFEQSAGYYIKQHKSVLRFGLYGYTMALLLIGIFLISIAGAIIAVGGMAAVTIISCLGQIPIAIVIGHILLSKRMPVYNTYVLFAVGIFVIDLLKMPPVIGDIMIFLILPYLALGIFSVYTVHKYFYHNFVSFSFEKGMTQQFDREKMNKIILSRNEDNKEV